VPANGARKRLSFCSRIFAGFMASFPPMKNSVHVNGITRRHFLATSTLALAAPTLIPASALGRGGQPAPSERITMGVVGWGMMGPGMMYGFGGGWFMGIFMILFWGLIIWGIIALVRYFSRTRTSDSQDTSALEILKKRYARGEISQEEYEEKKKALI